MFANITETVYLPGRREAARTRVEEFHAFAAQQPGLQRTIQVDTGEGHFLTLTLWASEEALEASRPVVGAAAERLLRAHWAAPGKRLGFGEVVRDTSTPGATFAVLSQVVYAPGQQEAGQAAAEEYRALVDRQPGACGGIFFTIGGGQQLILRLWASAAQQEASAQVRQAAFDRLVAPWQAAPLQPLGKGAIVRDTTPPAH